MSHDPLRVCILISRYPPDFTGQGIQVQRMLPWLIEEGIQPTIVTARPQEGVQGRLDEIVPVHRVLRPGREPWSKVQRAITTSRFLRAHHDRFDVLHAIILDWGLYLHAAWLKRRGISILHEMILLGSDDPVAIGTHRFGGWKVGRLRDHVDLWIGITRAFLPTLDAAGIPRERFRLLYGGVDVERYRPRSPDERRELRRRLGLPEDARIAICAGALQPRKAMERVLDAWEAAKPEPGRDLLLLVGPATREEGLREFHLAYAAEIRRRSETPPLAGTVRIVGRVDDLEAWMGASDLFVFLSRREGLGYVILEAMASGLPCVVSPLDGIARELIDPGRTGFIAENPDDADAVAERIRQLLPESPGRLEIQRAARRECEERFSMRARARTLAGLYREVRAASRP